MEAIRYARVPLCMVLVLFCLALTGTVRADEAADPWYRDVRDHWSYTYVRVLWEERVTDGYVYHTHGTRAYYRPDKTVSRGQYTLMLAHAFQLEPVSPSSPTFSDVNSRYEPYPGKSGWEYVEAAHSNDIVHGFPDGTFRPDEALRRDHAVALLVRSLGLTEVAEQLAQEDVAVVLGRFRDWHHTEASVRNEVAVAVMYGIVEGYPDHTLRPGRELTRAESAALIYRSCVYRVAAAPRLVVRGEPGLDHVELLPFILKNRSVVEYSLSITTPRQQEVWSYDRSRHVSVPLPTVTWSGTTDHDRDVRPGQYLLTGEATDRGHHLFSAVPKPVYVFDPALSALASPSTVRPGDSLQLRAWTRATAHEVAALPCASMNVGFAPLSSRQTPASPPDPRQSQQWVTEYEVPLTARQGNHEVVVEARFDLFGHLVLRRDTVTIHVLPVLTIEGMVTPNPAAPGSTVELAAETQPAADRVTARLLGQQVELTPDPGGSSWTGLSSLGAVEPGTYPVRFTAQWGKETRHTTVVLVVRRIDESDLVYLLVH